MKYVIGVDFGTLSCRAVLVTRTGEPVRSAVMEYPHGVIDAPMGGALQDPQDYLDCLCHTVRKVAGGYEKDIVSLGIDFTSCTVLAVDRDMKPLEHARLWKSHSAQPQADRINALCARMGISLAAVGGRMSSESLIPKLLELKECRPEVYGKTALFLDAGDWLTCLLTGRQVRSVCTVGFKGMWKDGWPTALLEALDLDESKLAGEVLPTGSFAGTLCPWGGEFLGLRPETAVAAACIDAHAAMPAAGLRNEGELMLILGTSGCHMLQSRTDVEVPGIFGKMKDGVLPGYVTYECGQSCLGDLFGWFVENCVPHKYFEAAGGDVFGYLEELAADVRDDPVWAIDWWNGNRCPYADNALTGTLFGLSLSTRPEHIYRALLEAAAFGTRQIFDTLETGGVKIKKVFAGGGISKKNRLFMQILADVLGREIFVTENEPASAMGAAILAAWAGGLYESPEAAIAAMAKEPGAVYRPDPDADYEKAYARYVKTADIMAGR